MSGQTEKTGMNRLINEKSPYLIQHAYQPVDWYAWGEAAFKRAKSEDRPVLVSIGYSTCHWCHVMAGESFDDPKIAELMNRYFVNIKVDREERPDVDSFYMTAVSSLTGSAGWPLNVFLTPDGKPFFGGTYFPPQARHGMPGWADVLNRIYQAWKDPGQRAKIESSAAEIGQKLEQHFSGASYHGDDTPLSLDLVRDAVQAFAEDYDTKNGGFGSAPKFPMPPILNFLLTFYRFSRETGQESPLGEKAFGMVKDALDAMAKGGIYDHIGGGFHRYSTDAIWHVPHFEKMLYDNAQLIEVYTDAYQITADPYYADVAGRTIDYVLREMTHPEGGFYSAEDADSAPPDPSGGQPGKREGAFYVWSFEELESLLAVEPAGTAAEVFYYIFDVREDGNVAQDPFGEFKGRNILHQVHSIDEAAAHFGLPERKIRESLARVKKRLFVSRQTRLRPHLDDKILTAWNGLMISALARASVVFDSPGYLAAAEGAVGFIYNALYDPDTRRLYRRWRDKAAGVAGLADDYTFLINGLIHLYEANFKPWLLEWALELMHRFIDDFVDPHSGMVYMNPKSHDPYLAFQMKDAVDNVTPSAASAAVRGLVKLYRISGDRDFGAAAEAIFRYAGGEMGRFPKMAPYLMTAALISSAKHVHMVIAGSPKRAETKKMIDAGRRAGGVGQSMVVVGDDADRAKLSRVLPDAENTGIPASGAVAQVCFERACRPPIDSPEKLTEQLERGFK